MNYLNRTGVMSISLDKFLKQEITFRQNHVYFNKISFRFLLSSEAFSNNGELLSTIDKNVMKITWITNSCK